METSQDIFLIFNACGIKNAPSVFPYKNIKVTVQLKCKMKNYFCLELLTIASKMRITSSALGIIGLTISLGTIRESRVNLSQ